MTSMSISSSFISVACFYLLGGALLLVNFFHSGCKSIPSSSLLFDSRYSLAVQNKLM